MSDKRADRYCGMAMRRKSQLLEVENKFHTMCMNVESAADEVLKIGNESDNKKLIEYAQVLLQHVMVAQGWLEG